MCRIENIMMLSTNFDIRILIDSGKLLDITIILTWNTEKFDEIER